MTDLDARYGRRPKRRWVLPVVASTLLIIGIAWVSWIALQDRPLSTEVFGYDVADEHSTTITIDVYRSRDIRVECTVSAQAQDHSTVGELTFTLPAGEGHLRHSETIETQQRAVTAVIDRCDPIES